MSRPAVHPDYLTMGDLLDESLDLRILDNACQPRTKELTGFVYFAVFQQSYVLLNEFLHLSNGELCLDLL